ncbi:aldehyde dehydrogenase family protein [Sphingomonadales bacterium 56]|uniref:Aldehyde dehydrogenase n=1 Tax=Sphingobium indicum (strain DSM 16412 / CCM 7286 / MTCC 6364 / B90A) TaxID=861109 RepID=A0A1L5BRJ7_SPHIB|nr:MULTISPECIES: aldehyde dehydrogenase family protein [Sphingobium]MBY2930676.1 aldehyde dehydrogenase family protein [Sphingomonadales bacterium 56]MBY2960782.1 aldehyde dehydrogenase family protein [Sphingomonadales bacterium 58]APL95514.1 aldehyde dehydrogenase [Sphingobium indicum B90A]CAD7341735.1 3-succinoylsemialdehyde-pyridine dehydrogenase [Sphingobium sp. S6]CAD7341933.1 3-succinoylsemialdehyde-pyridine dehydrogenase [Sphingobium sp. S8]
MAQKIYVDGQWRTPTGERHIDVVNPATEAVIGSIGVASKADVDDAVAAARRAFLTFSRTSREERIDLLGRVLGAYVARRQELADALVEELGAPAKFAFETQSATGLMHLQTTIELLRDYPFETRQSDRTMVRHEPIGVVALITPWNWPINQIMCKIAPALATGNTMVHKPSELTPFTAHVIAQILDDAGVPKGVYNLVDGDGTVGAMLAEHANVDMVSFTGSTRAGIDVAKRAADTVKRVHQELGGKSPNIILDDADLGAAIGGNLYRLMLNSGQSCHAPTRMLVPRSRMEEAKGVIAHILQGITVGDPHGDAYMGPVVSRTQWERIQSYIDAGQKEGATLLAGGGGRPNGLSKGYYVKPTVFVDVTNDMRIAREEIFGPVLCVIGYDDLDEAVRIANDTPYGLAAFVQSASDDKAAEVGARLDAGMIFLNGAGEDPLAPFGGTKMSGNGREWGLAAFGEFMESKALIRAA